ncbi:MAG: hypothetical protein AB1439_06230 [candidate division FCPU426 bacterium]
MNRYIVVLAGTGLSRSTDNHLLRLLLDYLDDRCWSVRVWYHGRLPWCLRWNTWLTNAYYWVRLAWNHRATILADSRLYPHLRWSLGRSPALGLQDWFLVAGDGAPRIRRRFGLNRRCQVVLDQSWAWTQWLAKGWAPERLLLLPQIHVSLARELKVRQFHTPSSAWSGQWPPEPPSCLQEALERLDAIREGELPKRLNEINLRKNQVEPSEKNQLAVFTPER